MVVRGKLQREGIVIHVVADALIDRSDLLARLGETDTGPFRAPIAHADHAKSSGPPDPRDPHAQRRERTLLDDFRADQAAFQAPVARADAVGERRPAARDRGGPEGVGDRCGQLSESRVT